MYDIVQLLKIENHCQTIYFRFFIKKLTVHSIISCNYIERDKSLFFTAM